MSSDNVIGAKGSSLSLGNYPKQQTPEKKPKAALRVTEAQVETREKIKQTGLGEELDMEA